MTDRRLVTSVLRFMLLIASLALVQAQSSTELLVNKARSLEGRGRADLAAQSWQQVLLADPNQQEALAALARFAKQNGRSQESAAYLERLRKINPNHSALGQVQTMRVVSQQQARLKEAERLASNQQFDQALQVYREVFGGEPPPGGYAIAYYETQAAVPGGWESATAALRKLSDSYPDSEDYRLSLGRLLTYRPATRFAGIHMLESIKTNSATASKARQAWRQALVWEAANPQAIPPLRSYLARYPDAELQKTLATIPQAAPTQGAPQAAQRTGLAQTPTENLGYAALKVNKIKDAETHFEKALAENGKSSGALAGMGFVRMKQEEFASAVDYFERAKAGAEQDSVVADALETARFWKAMKQGGEAFRSNHLDAAIEKYREAAEIRPASVEAAQALGGAYAKSGDAASAAATFDKLLESQPKNEEFWRQLINARYRSAGADSALAASRRVPESVHRTLDQNLEYLAVMASAYSDLNDFDESKQLLARAVEIANTRGTELSIPLQLQFAGLFLRHGQGAEAATIFERVVDLDSASVDAWEGLLASLVREHQEAKAMRLVLRMPKDAYDAAGKRAGFLRSLAAVHTALGQLDAAQVSLEKSIRLSPNREDTSSIASQLQLAQIWVRQGRIDRAEPLLRRLAGTYPENPDVWKALIAALHEVKQDSIALREDRRMPAGVSASLRSDADYSSLLAACENGLGNYDEALRHARRAENVLRQQKRPLPPALEIQTAWLLLNTQADQQELYATLQRLGARYDLPPADARAVSEIWSTWSLRRAQAAIASGDKALAIAILEGAVRLLPKDVAIRSALTGALLTAGEQQKALRAYKEWSLSGGNSGDYAGAIGTAMAQNEHSLAAGWLTTALSKWPSDPQLLTMAAKQAASAGDYKRAENYWRAALIALPRESSNAGLRNAGAPGAPAQATPSQTMGQLLLGPDAVQVDRGTAAGTAAQPETPLPSPGRTEPSKSKSDRISEVRRLPGGAEVRYVSYSPVASAEDGPAPNPAAAASVLPKLSGSDVQNNSVLPRMRTAILEPEAQGSRVSQPNSDSAYPTLPPTANLNMPAPFVEPTKAPSLRKEVEDQLDAIAARNTPFMGMGSSITGRSGDAGFERLLIQQADIEASNIIAGHMRVSVIARPTYLDAGEADGQSIKRFGLLPTGATFGSQSVGGIAGEVQVSTETLGMRFGSTPTNFLLRNFVGGIRFRPGNGPITLIAERDVIKDSMLSYAGVKDPVSNRVWGGVVANSFSAIGKWGGAASGFYASVGFQNITGLSVQDNKRMDGNFGTYWRVINLHDSTLTAGLNFSAMHYEKNLRYFTIGHGGYFSPQQYFLFNVPVQWRGTYHRTIQYSATGSLGSQHFQEDQAPLFPTLPAVQGRNGPYYDAQSATGANYSLDARVARQITPDWYLGGFMNLNNARNYNSQAAGVVVKYTFRPRSLNAEADAPAIPDWRGVEPFRVQ